MSSRERILGAITSNKPAFIESPVMDIKGAAATSDALVQQFIKTLGGIGGKAVQISSTD